MSRIQVVSLIRDEIRAQQHQHYHECGRREKRGHKKRRSRKKQKKAKLLQKQAARKELAVLDASIEQFVATQMEERTEGVSISGASLMVWDKQVDLLAQLAYAYDYILVSL